MKRGTNFELRKRIAGMEREKQNDAKRIIPLEGRLTRLGEVVARTPGYPAPDRSKLLPINAAEWICEMRILDTLDSEEELALRSLLWWVHDRRKEK